MVDLIAYVVLLPLFGFLFNGLLGARIRSEKVVGTVGSGVVGLSFLLASLIFFHMIALPVEERSQMVHMFRWISAGTLETQVAFLVDQLSILMVLIVTGVGFIIHVYSIGYMHGDPGYWRFFSYMNLFIVAMLVLVLADNFLLFFVGWEGVGLCSYLLIGFWYDKRFEKATTSDAANKAFIVNRVGDFGFLVAMLLVYVTFGSLNFGSVFARANALSVGETSLFLITLLLLIGATGKSAQIPLFVWLPDAMAGPTPVSALIHAATMVTAGVYMIARCAILFALAPATMGIVAVVGALTAVFAASIGLVQNGIKKVLAYSTISQLGYMFLAMGVGAFTAGMFHLLTHAFFKALLFLGAGAVIHAMQEEEDIQRMGGLKQRLPTTYKTFVVAAFAIAGIPPLSGFFSKDEILWNAFNQGSWFLWLVGALGAVLTAFYMFRLVILTFEGSPRYDPANVHPHEAPRTMTVPLIVLAVLSAIGGFFGIPHSLGGGNLLGQWLEPTFAGASEIMRLPTPEVHAIEYVLMFFSVALAAAGIYAAWKVYLKRKELLPRLVSQYQRVYDLLWNKYYVDEIYDASIVVPTFKGSEKLLWRGLDVLVIDGAVNGIAKLISMVSLVSRRVQVGVAQTYAVVFVFGIVMILAWLIL